MRIVCIDYLRAYSLYLGGNKNVDNVLQSVAGFIYKRYYRPLKSHLFYSVLICHASMIENRKLFWHFQENETHKVKICWGLCLEGKYGTGVFDMNNDPSGV